MLSPLRELCTFCNRCGGSAGVQNQSAWRYKVASDFHYGVLSLVDHTGRLWVTHWPPSEPPVNNAVRGHVLTSCFLSKCGVKLDAMAFISVHSPLTFHPQSRSNDDWTLWWGEMGFLVHAQFSAATRVKVAFESRCFTSAYCWCTSKWYK